MPPEPAGGRVGAVEDLRARPRRGRRGGVHEAGLADPRLALERARVLPRPAHAPLPGVAQTRRAPPPVRRAFVSRRTGTRGHVPLLGQQTRAPAPPTRRTLSPCSSTLPEHGGRGEPLRRLLPSSVATTSERKARGRPRVRRSSRSGTSSRCACITARRLVAPERVLARDQLVEQDAERVEVRGRARPRRPRTAPAPRRGASPANWPSRVRQRRGLRAAAPRRGP